MARSINHDNYSNKEKQLITAFGWGFENKLHMFSGPQLYDIMALRAFYEGCEGNHVDSLRRMVRALHKCEIYRNTQKWDDLIQL